jgi:ABC-2 type transport system ATP-binding protein
MLRTADLDRGASRPALEATGLSKWYRAGGARALNDVSVALPSGSMTAFLGPNGAGKSTLFRTWLRFEKPSAGGVRVDGIDPWADAGASRALAYVPQVLRPYPGLRVEDHLRLAASLRRGFDLEGARSRVQGLKVPLTQFASALSGGQRAQLFLAIALATRAAILLLDEPLASLDPLARREFLGALAEARLRQGLTVVIASHVVADLEEICDRVLLLAHGRLVLDDTLSECRRQHWLSHERAAESIAELPQIGRPSLFLNRGVVRDGELPAPLEDIVLGHLAIARDGLPQ